MQKNMDLSLPRSIIIVISGDNFLKIVIITQDEPFYVPLVIEMILKERNDIYAITAIPPYIKSSSTFSTFKIRLKTYGIDYVLKISLMFLISKILVRLKYKRPFSLEKLSKTYSIKYLFTKDVNDERFLGELININPELIISISPPQIFKKKILSIPSKGVINVHGALLPRYKGLQPSFWVLTNDEQFTGVTLHYMNEKLDAGEIILQEKVPINKNDTQFSVMYKTKKLSIKLILESINLIEQNSVKTKKMNSEEGSYYSFPTKEDVKKFKQKKKKLVTWKDLLVLLRGFKQ